MENLSQDLNMHIAWIRNFSNDLFLLEYLKLNYNNFFWQICQLEEETKDESDILKVLKQLFVYVAYIHGQKCHRKQLDRIRDPNTSIRWTKAMNIQAHQTSNVHEIENLVGFYENWKHKYYIFHLFPLAR